MIAEQKWCPKDLKQSKNGTNGDQNDPKMDPKRARDLQNGAPKEQYRFLGGFWLHVGSKIRLNIDVEN